MPIIPLEMRRLWESKEIKLQTKIAEMFGVCISVTYNILTRKTWKHV